MLPFINPNKEGLSCYPETGGNEIDLPPYKGIQIGLNLLPLQGMKTHLTSYLTCFQIQDTFLLINICHTGSGNGPVCHILTVAAPVPNILFQYFESLIACGTNQTCLLLCALPLCLFSIKIFLGNLFNLTESLNMCTNISFVGFFCFKSIIRLASVAATRTFCLYN